MERDTVPKTPRTRTQWTCRQHVKSNLTRLGTGVSVFFLYAPNPDDLYKPPGMEDRPQLRNKFYMSRLFFDLELHGFHVLSDMHLGDTQPTNWVQWYVTRISCCNYVVFVCSPAFRRLFEDENLDMDKLTNPKARHLLGYRNAVYSCIEEEVTKGGRGKFIPVILDGKYKNWKDCVPLLFQAGTVYCLKEEKQKRKFDFDNKKRDFEKLVCHMAGINRIEIEMKEQQGIAQVPTLPGPSFSNKSEQ